MYYIYLLLNHLLFTIIIFIKDYLYFCKIRSDINLSLYRSSNERYRDMQLMSVYRMCRGIVRLPSGSCYSQTHAFSTHFLQIFFLMTFFFASLVEKY